MRLQLAPHSHKSDSIVELRTDAGELVACIYSSARGLKIVSKYILNHPMLVAIDAAEPPAMLIDLARGMGK